MEEDWEDHEEKGSPCETKRNETRLKFEITRTDVGNIAAAVVNMEEDEEIDVEDNKRIYPCTTCAEIFTPGEILVCDLKGCKNETCLKCGGLDQMPPREQVMNDPR